MFNPVHLKFEIVYDFQLYPIAFAPIGWDKLDITGDLSDTFLTVWSKVNSDLKFVYDGAELLRQIVFTKGANASALLRIYKRHEVTGEYKLRISQNIDFQKFSDINGIFSVGLLQKGVAANIDTFKDVQYSIPVEDLALGMNIGGIGLSEYIQFISGTVEIPNVNPPDGGTTPYVFSPSLSIQDTTSSPDVLHLESDYVQYSGPLNELDTTDVFPIENISLSPVETRFKGSMSFSATPIVTSTPYIDIFIYDDLGNKFFLNQNLLLVYGDYPEGRLYKGTAEFDITIILQPGVKYTLVIDPNFQFPEEFETVFGTLLLEYVDMRVDYSTYTEDYTVKGLRSFDLFKALLGKMNPNSNLNISAPVLESGLGKRIIVASGDNIRGIRGAVIQSSFNDFISSFNPQLFAGLKMYDDQSIKYDVLNNIQFNRFAFCGSLGTVKDAKYESISQDYAGAYKVGYPDNSYDRVDGRDEFNTEVTTIVPEAKAVNPVEIMSTYRADPRGVDELIIDYRTTPTKDNTGDKQNWEFVIKEQPNEETGLYNLTGPEIFQKVEGTSALGRIYNLELAPIFMFMRNTARVAVQFALAKMGQVKFESSKKNGDLKITKFNGDIIEENSTTSYDQMNAPLYLPIKCTFTAIMTDDDYDKIIGSSNNSGGYITFVDRNQEMKGFLVSYSYNLTYDNVKEFVVYLHPDTDMTKLFNLSN